MRHLLHGMTLLALLALCAGCLGSLKQPALVTTYYQLAYPPPAAAGGAPLAAVVKVRPFMAAATYDSTSITFQEEPLEVGRYIYRRWAADPGPMVSDLLIRDLRAEGLYKAITTSPSNLEPTVEVSGGVVALDGLYYNEQARMAVQTTVVRNFSGPSPDSVLFQKVYEEFVPLEEEEADDLAAALSQAMEKISARFRKDLAEAVRGIVEKQKK